MIAGVPALVAEARAALPALQSLASWPAGDHGVKLVIGKRFAIYPQPVRLDGEWTAWWAEYFTVLSDTPLAALEAGMRAYVALPDSEFMPKPGRLRELARKAPCRAIQRYNQARRAVALAASAPTERVDRETVAALLADYIGKPKAKP